MQFALNFINGQWRPTASGRTYECRNPADTRELVARYPVGGPEDAQAAVEAACKATSTWSALTPVARGRFLSRASQLLESRKGQLAERLTREEGKTLRKHRRSATRRRHLPLFRGTTSWMMP